MDKNHEGLTRWHKPKIEASVLEISTGQWCVHQALVWYATRPGKITADVCTSIATGETRPTYEEIVQWLETKARRAVGDIYSLNELERTGLIFDCTVKIRP